MRQEELQKLTSLVVQLNKKKLIFACVYTFASVHRQKDQSCVCYSDVYTEKLLVESFNMQAEL